MRRPAYSLEFLYRPPRPIARGGASIRTHCCNVVTCRPASGNPRLPAGVAAQPDRDIPDATTARATRAMDRFSTVTEAAGPCRTDLERGRGVFEPRLTASPAHPCGQNTFIYNRLIGLPPTPRRPRVSQREAARPSGSGKATCRRPPPFNTRTERRIIRGTRARKARMLPGRLCCKRTRVTIIINS
jgi:hypothetical protein